MRRNLLAVLLLALALFLTPHAGCEAAQRVTVCNPSGIRESGVHVDELLSQSMREQGIARPPLTGQFPKTATESLDIREDALNEINDLFYKRGWTDGLPIVPPTPERVRDMLRGADLSPEFEIAVLSPLDGVATVEKIAVNAVMAGCSPAHMPVLLAAVEAVARPEFDLRGMSTTTNPDAALLIVSGPVVKKLGINAGTNTFGKGNRANAVISRAFHLILHNIGGSRPGVTDMSTLGQPGDFVMFFAENAEANPWLPFHTALGHPDAANVVTVAPVEGYSGILGIGQSREGFLKLVASWMRGQDRPYRQAVLLVIAQDTAQMLAAEGWTREKMTAFIRRHAKVPFRVFKEEFIDTGMAKKGVPAGIFKIEDPEQPVDKPFLDNLYIIVAGGTGEKSMILPCWAAGRPVSSEIRLPSFWDELVREERNQ